MNGFDVADVFRPRVRRLVAAMRAVFAAASLLAIWLDRSQPAMLPGVVYALLAAYLFYAAALAAARLLSAGSADALDSLTLAIDIVVLSALLFLTSGPSSPFFVWFSFILVAAALTRGWRAAALIALLLTAIYGLGSAAFLRLADPDGGFELQRFVIRAAYLAVSGMLFAYYGREQERINAEVARVFGGARGTVAPADASPLAHALAHVLDVLHAERAVLAWENEDEPRPQLATLDAGGFARRATAPDPALPGADRGDFAVEPSGRVLTASGRGEARGLADLVARARRLAGAGALLSCEVEQEEGAARLFVARADRFRREDLAVGRLLAAQVSAGLARTAALDRLSEVIAAENRVRVSRDLHDGILQSLAGAALQLEGVAPDHPDLDARRRIAAVQTLLVEEQRQLRALIDRLRPWTPRAADPARLAPDLAILAASLGRQWPVTVNAAVSPPDLELPEPVRFEVQQIVREGVANAVRHGSASAVDVAVARDGPVLRVVISDDGDGLDRHGRFDAASVRREKIGSRSLRERVEQGGGELALESAPSGLHVAIALPLGE